MEFRDLWEQYQSIHNRLIDMGPHEGPINPAVRDKEAEELERQEDALAEIILGHPESFGKVR